MFSQPEATYVLSSFYLESFLEQNETKCRILVLMLLLMRQKATKSKIKTEVEHSGSLPALADDVELDSFTDVAVDETTESKAKKSKIKTEL